VEAEGATVEIVAPTVGGIEASDGTWIEGHQKIGGGPSVLYDAVVVLASDAEASMLAKLPAARQFAADAFAHLKFIGYTKAALPLFQKAGIADDLDSGCVELKDAKSVKAFVSACRSLRMWEREEVVGGL
jgi:catalase